jgi:NitT/TauT family transport system ATP-binding protein
MTNTNLTGKTKVLGSTKKKSGNLDIKNITISFGKGSDKVTAVENINLSIEAGSFICILGPSGCGKSTLLNSIAGFVKPTSGNIYLDAKEVSEPGPDRGMVFQQYSLLPWKTTFENILLGPRLAGDLEATEISERLLSMVGLAKYRDHYPSQLSGGMQQRVGIARALATQPGVLLMDEPFGALDAQTRNFMQENLLQVWSETGTTVVFVTHDVDESIFLSDKIIVMGSNPGQIISQFDNELPRPREQELSTSKEFIELKRKCLDVIRTESNKAFDFQNLN